MLIDIYEKYGLDVIAQVDLDRRVHRNQDTKSLGRMAFIIIKTFLDRIQKQERAQIKQLLFDEMIQYGREGDRLLAHNFHLEQYERPPMIDVSQYRAKFGKDSLLAS
jgi:glucosyl-3-phosphoglycerate synthase